MTKLMLAIILILSIHINSKQFVPPLGLREAHIPIALDPNQRSSHYPLVTGETFRAFADFVIDETTSSFDSEQLKTGDTIFVGMPYLNFFLGTILPHIRTKFILITSNGSGTITEKHLPYLNNNYLHAWFGRNMVISHPKIQKIPLGFCWFEKTAEYYPTLKKYLSQTNLNSFFAAKPTHTYLNIAITHSLRTLIQQKFANVAFCKVSNRLPFPNYFHELVSARFIISPRGYNIDCFRHYEALIAGSIPVIEAHGIEEVYADLPVIIVNSYEQVTEQFLNDQFEAMKTKNYNLNKLHADYWLDLIRNAQQQAIITKE